MCVCVFQANPEDVSDVEYTLDSPQPFTHYLFQVSCMRDTDSPWSEWSHSYKVQSSEAGKRSATQRLPSTAPALQRLR